MTVALREAWRTVVPDRNDRHGPLQPLMLVLTVVTGLVDAFSYLSLGHVFVANMTGNVVFGGFAIAGVGGFSLVATVVALAAFAGGALLGGRVIRRGEAHRAGILYRALVVEVLLVGAAFVVAELSGTPGQDGTRYPLLVLLGLGLGVQNATARSLAVPDLTTTVLTLTITGTAADSRLAGGPGSRAGRRLLSAAAMFLGGLIGALLLHSGRHAAPLLIATVLLAVACITARRLARSRAPWTQAP
ncbi:YoaK family protein [Kribbella sp. NPDC050241]|uniref:YoaK family protein n=1 Tax=Kribbella sp. NPDC050241 TaxID=3364115 RepID=UPI0037BC8126